MHAETLGPAHGGGDGWVPGVAAQSGAGAFQLGAGASWAPGLVPEFRAGSRDRLSFGVGGRWRVAEPVELSFGFDGIRDAAPGATVIGPGDVRLGATARVVQHKLLSGWLGFGAKLPNASDEGEIGTDETDVTFGAGVVLAADGWRATAGGGLAVLGNPLRFANQDDVPLVRIAGAKDLGPLTFGAALNADLQTPRNPARVLTWAWARATWQANAPCPFFVELSGGAGMTPAAPDGIVGLSVGVSRVGLPVNASGE